MKLFCPKCNVKSDVGKPSESLMHEHGSFGGNRKVDRTETDERWACLKCFTIICVPVFPNKLIDVPFDVACGQKFAIGRAEHGPVFLNNPVAEIDMELIDAVNYAHEAIRQGFDASAMNAIITKLKEVDQLVRTVYRSHLP